MALPAQLHLVLLFFLAISSSPSSSLPTPKLSSYIIHTYQDLKPLHFTSSSDWYHSLLQYVTNATISSSVNTGQSRMIYSYEAAMSGFSARLTDQEAQDMARAQGVIKVSKSIRMKLHTTRTPSFLGLDLDHGIWPDTSMGDGVIIGLIDSGIWPESMSFRDDSLRPPDPRWRGGCESGTRFRSSMCNNKLIGARYFVDGYMAEEGAIPPDEFLSPRDVFGHGTHTASTAAGAPVANASVLGFANGTARGIATNAKIAMYKACWGSECEEADVIAAIDAAIDDIVDVLSISLGGGGPNFYSDGIAVSTLSAAEHGIFVACSAGNDGPTTSDGVINSAPWITTVGASSIDRSFPVQLQLGNGATYVGQSLYNHKVEFRSMAPLVYGGSCFDMKTRLRNITGKIVVCEGGGEYDGDTVKNASGAGIVTVNEMGNGVLASMFTLPSLAVGKKDGRDIVSYINNTYNPKAAIKTKAITVVGRDRAPEVAFFSSRNPNPLVPELLKPDILAPGLNILAAAPSEASDHPQVPFAIHSGTSMACPHIAGVAALLRKAHPEWSPAVIRSAMMTSATGLDNGFRHLVGDEYEEGAATPFDYGAGQVQPQMALNPGLVYDAGIDDYVLFLCSLNFTDQQLQVTFRRRVVCPMTREAPGNLNYPSFSVVFDEMTTMTVLRRTVTFVAELPESFRSRVVNPRPDLVEVSVSPDMMAFHRTNEKQSYSVVFESKSKNKSLRGMKLFGNVILENNKRVVRSPFAVIWK